MAPRPLSPGGPDRVGPGQKNRVQARRRRKRRANPAEGPRCFLRRSRLSSSGSAQSSSVTSGPGSTRGRRGRGRRWAVTTLCGHFATAQRCDPEWAQSTAGADGCERQQKRGFGLLESGHGISSGFCLPAPPAGILYKPGFFCRTPHFCVCNRCPAPKRHPDVRGVDKRLLFPGRYLVEEKLGLLVSAQGREFLRTF